MNTQQALNVVIGADTDPRFNKIIKQARDSFGDVNHEIIQLRKNQGLIKTFNLKTESVDKAKERILKARDALAQLKKQASANPTANLDKDIDKATQSVKKLEKQLKTTQTAQTNASKAIKDAGLSTKDTTAQTEQFIQKQRELLAQAKLNHSAYGRASQALKHQENQVKLTSDALRRYQLEQRGMTAEQSKEIIQREKAVASLKRHQQQQEQLRRKVKDYSVSIAKAGVATTAFASVLAVGALTRYSLEIMKIGKEASAMAQAIGMSREELQKWQYAGERVGLSADNIADILKDVSDKVGDFSITEGGAAIDAFEKLNLNINELKNQAPDKVLLSIASAMDKVKLSQSEKVFLYESLGSDLSKLAPLLKNNAKGLKELTQQAVELGAVMDDTRFARLESANEKISELKGGFKGLWNEAVMTFVEIADVLDLDDSFQSLRQNWGDFNDLLHNDSIGDYIEGEFVVWESVLGDMTESWGTSLAEISNKAGEFWGAYIEQVKTNLQIQYDLFLNLPAHVKYVYTLMDAEINRSIQWTINQYEILGLKTGKTWENIQHLASKSLYGIEKVGAGVIDALILQLADFVESAGKAMSYLPMFGDELAGQAKTYASELRHSADHFIKTISDQKKAMTEHANTVVDYDNKIKNLTDSHKEYSQDVDKRISDAKRERDSLIAKREEHKVFIDQFNQAMLEEEQLNSNQKTSVKQLTSATTALSNSKDEATKKTEQLNDAIKKSQQALEYENIYLNEGRIEAEVYKITLDGFSDTKAREILQNQDNTERLQQERQMREASTEALKQANQALEYQNILKAEGELQAEIYRIGDDGKIDPETAKKIANANAQTEQKQQDYEKNQQVIESLKELKIEYELEEIAITQGADAMRLRQLALEDYTEQEAKVVLATEKHIKSLQRWGEINDTINDGLTDGIVNAVKTGKFEFESLADSIKNIFEDMVLRPQIQAIVSQVGGQLLPQQGGQGGIDYGSLINKGMEYFNPQSSATTIVEQQYDAFSNPFATGADGFVASNETQSWHSGLTGTGGMLSQGESLMSGGWGGGYNILANIGGNFVGKAIAGEKDSGLAGLEASIGMTVAGPAGAVVGALHGALVDRIFGDDDSPRAHLTGKAGLEGNDGLYLDANAEQLYGKQFTSANPFGQLNAVADGTHDIGKEGDQKLLSLLSADEYYGKLLASVSDQDKVAEINAEWKDYDYSGVEGLDGMFKDRLVTMSEGLDPLLRNLVDWEDSTADITKRIDQVTASANHAVPWLKRFDIGINQTQAELIAGSVALTDYAGGVQNFSRSMDAYYLNFYSDTERSQHVYAKALGEVKAINDILGLTGADMMDTHAEYRQVLESIDTSDEKGQKLFEQMRRVMGSVDLIADSGLSAVAVYNKLPDDMQKTTLDNADSAKLVLEKLEANNKKATDEMERLGDTLDTLADKVDKTDKALNRLGNSADNLAKSSQDSANNIDEFAENFLFDENF